MKFLGSLFFATLILSADVYASSLGQLCRYVHNREVEKISKKSLKTLKGIEESTLGIISGAIFGENLVDCLNTKPRFNFGPIKYYSLKSYGIESFILEIKFDRNQDIDKVNLISFPDDLRISQAQVISQGEVLHTFIGQRESTKNDKLTTILYRTPYLLHSAGKISGIISEYTALGYNVVLQPIRGTFLTTGEMDWLNWKDEAQDALATLDWIQKQPWSNAKVVSVGTSYPGFTALASTLGNHPTLIGALTGSAPVNASLDSLSKASMPIEATAYTVVLNGDSTKEVSSVVRSSLFSHLEVSKRSSLNTSDGKLFGKKYKTYNKQFGKVSKGQTFDTGDEFIKKLKMSEVPTLHSYGVVNDQDSIDSIRTYRQLDGLENHFLLEHNYGHGTEQFKSILKGIITLGDKASREDVSAILSGTMGNKNIAKISREDGVYTYTFGKKLSDINVVEKVNYELEKVKGEGDYYKIDLPVGKVAKGPLKFKVKFNSTSSDGALWKYLEPSLCTESQSCSKIDISHIVFSTLQSGREVEVESNSTFFQVVEGGTSLQVKFPWTVKTKDFDGDLSIEKVFVEIPYLK